MKVAACGANSNSQSGTGTRNPVNSTFVSASLFGDTVEELAASYHFVAARLADGSLRLVGGNGQGELGDGTTFEKSTPVDPGLGDVVQIAASGAHNIALLADGQVATWGGNRYGTLGNGTRTEVEGMVGAGVPLVLPYMFSQVACGGGNCYALDSVGIPFAWGEGKSGQIGDGTRTDKLVPTPINLRAKRIAAGGIGSLTGHVVALLPDGRVACWGANQQGQSAQDTLFKVLTRPMVVPDLEDVSQVLAGSTTSFAITSTGELLAWGSLPSGVKANIPTLIASNVTTAAAGTNDLLYVSEGLLYGVGQNDSGQLGDGTREDRLEPVQALGLGEVRQIVLGQADGVTHTAALHNGDLATQHPIVVIPITEGLVIDWDFPMTSKRWTLRHRPSGKRNAEWKQNGQVPSDTRSFTFDKLTPGVEYDLYLQNGDFGWQVVRGVAG